MAVLRAARAPVRRRRDAHRRHRRHRAVRAAALGVRPHDRGRWFDTFELAGRVERVRPGHRLPVRRTRHRAHDHVRRRWRGRPAVGPLRPPTAAALRTRRGRRGRDPWRRAGDAPGHQLRQPRGVVARRPPDVRRAAHARRQLVELPAAQARRLAGVPGQQRGDLLLPDRGGRIDRRTPPKASGCIAPTPATAGSTTT